MREIKFRCWDGFHMIKKSINDDYDDYYTLNLQGDFFGHTRTGDEWFNYSEDETNKRKFILMQYIGIKDVMGIEIYEGDIKLWEFNSEVRKYVCYWSQLDCGFRWKLIEHNSKQDEDRDIPFDTEQDYYDYVLKSNQRDSGFDSFSRIIGNIYEHQHLL